MSRHRQFRNRQYSYDDDYDDYDDDYEEEYESPSISMYRKNPSDQGAATLSSYFDTPGQNTDNGILTEAAPEASEKDPAQEVLDWCIQEVQYKLIGQQRPFTRERIAEVAKQAGMDVDTTLAMLLSSSDLADTAAVPAPVPPPAAPETDGMPPLPKAQEVFGDGGAMAALDEHINQTADALGAFKFDSPSPDDKARSLRDGRKADGLGGVTSISSPQPSAPASSYLKPSDDAQAAQPFSPPGATAGVRTSTPQRPKSPAMERSLSPTPSPWTTRMKQIQALGEEEPAEYSSEEDEDVSEEGVEGADGLDDCEQDGENAGAAGAGGAGAGGQAGAAPAGTRKRVRRRRKRDRLSLVVVGHVDAGKSTLLGQLLLRLGHVHQRQITKFEREARDQGKASFYLAWVMDEGTEERAHGVTMDIGQKHIKTPTKDITLLDAPGHQDFIPKMISGACQADVAVLVVPATTGEFEAGFAMNGQAKEHTVLVRSLGVKQILVAVNKLDAAVPPWSQDRYREMETEIEEFLRKTGFKPKQIRFVPVSGLTGINIVDKPPEGCGLNSWYTGPTFFEALDSFNPPQRDIKKPMRLTIADIIPAGGRAGVCVAGRVVQGRIKVGQRVALMPCGDVGEVRRLERDSRPLQRVEAGDNCEITVQGLDPLRVAVGDVVSSATVNGCVPVCRQFQAQVLTLPNLKVPIIRGTGFILHTQSLDVPCNVTKLVHTLNKSGEVKKKRPRAIGANMSAVVDIACPHKGGRWLCIERYEDCRALGRFVLRQKGITVAAGVVTALKMAELDSGT